MLPLYEISRGLAEGALDALIDRGPKLIDLWRSITQPTQQVAPPASKDFQDALNSELRNSPVPGK